MKSLQFILKKFIKIVIANFYYHINLLLGWKEEHILIAQLKTCFMKTSAHPDYSLLEIQSSE